MVATSPNVASVADAGRAKGLGGCLNFAGHFHITIASATGHSYLADAEPESPELDQWLRYPLARIVMYFSR